MAEFSKGECGGIQTFILKFFLKGNRKECEREERERRKKRKRSEM